MARAWYDRPLTVQVELLADPDPQVRAAATEHKQPGVPPEWRQRCLADAAVRYVPLTSEQFAQLMRSEEKEVHQAVAESPHLSAEMVARLLDIDEPLVRVAAAQSRHVDTETRDRLYALVEDERAARKQQGRDGSELELHRTRLAARSAPQRADDLPGLPVHAFRRVLASCHDLPEEAWRRLDNDPALAVRRAAARRPGTPPEVLEGPVRAHGDVFDIRPLLVDHPNFPRHVLRTFVDEPSPNVRYLALQDPELPVPDLQQLAAATESFLRHGVARHPNITDVLLEHLLSAPDPQVVDGAAANPALRPTRMYRMLTAAGL